MKKFKINFYENVLSDEVLETMIIEAKNKTLANICARAICEKINYVYEIEEIKY